MPANRSRDGSNAEALGLQIGNLVPFGTGELKISWHGNIAFLCGNKRISNPPAMLHFTSGFTHPTDQIVIQPAA